MASTGNSPPAASTWIRRTSQRLDHARSLSLRGATAARDDLAARRSALVEQARRLSWTGKSTEVRLIRRLIDQAITEGATASVVTALEDGLAISLAAPAARIRALQALASAASKSARPPIEERLVDIARREPDMSDTVAWVYASRAAKGRARTKLAQQAVTAAGRANEPGPLIAALDVADQPSASNLVHMAVAHVAHARAGVELGAGTFDSSALAASCDSLSPEGARKIARALSPIPAPPSANTAPFHLAACARLLARAAARLPDDEAAPVCSSVFRLEKEHADLWLDEAERDTMIAHLEGPDLEAALADPWSGSTGSLAERLAALGRPREARALLEQTGGGWYTARHALRAAAHAPKLRDLARRSVAALDPPARGRLCGETPFAAVQVLGAEAVLRFADEAGDETGHYVRIVALARVATALPEPQRSEAAARAVSAYRSDPDPDALCELVRCSPWMPEQEAAWLLFDSLARRDTVKSFEHSFAGYSGVAALAPLIARAAGDPGLLATSEAVVEAEQWSRRSGAEQPTSSK